MKNIPFLVVLVLCCALTGCAYYPMGLTRSEWKRLSPEQQASYWALEQREHRSAETAQVARTRRIDTVVKEVATPNLHMTGDRPVGAADLSR